MTLTLCLILSLSSNTPSIYMSVKAVARDALDMSAQFHWKYNLDSKGCAMVALVLGKSNFCFLCFPKFFIYLFFKALNTLVLYIYIVFNK